jgi:DNA-binding PadR family transcriptional regulator
MAVREALLGLLTIGPAYGLQLHYELGRRAPHRAKTNVGQIYATLERLHKAGLLAPAGANTEGLPLWKLTADGRDEALAWMSGANKTALPEWSDLLDAVLISRSVSPELATRLIENLLALIPSPSSSGNALADSANAHYREAVQAWLTEARNANGGESQGFELVRPKRGRPALPRATELVQ